MTDILGYDCDGKPLRAGDRIMRVVQLNVPLCKGNVGDIETVIGPSLKYPGSIEVDDPHPLGGWWSDYPSSYRKIDQPETGDWSEIEKQTGWRPRIEVEA